MFWLSHSYNCWSVTKAFHFILHTRTFLNPFLTLSYCRALVETCCYGKHSDLSNTWGRSCQAKWVHVKPHITAMQPAAWTSMEPSIHSCAHTDTKTNHYIKKGEHRSPNKIAWFVNSAGKALTMDIRKNWDTFHHK